MKGLYHIISCLYYILNRFKFGELYIRVIKKGMKLEIFNSSFMLDKN